MGINIFQVDAFSNKPFGGNPAGVVPHSKGLDKEMMQIIAREMNVSETAFIEELDTDLFAVRFFTPEKEVSLCGHATIGGFYMMAIKQYIRPIEEGVKIIEQITEAGRLPVFLEYKDGEIDRVFMEQTNAESFGKIDKLDKIAKSLNISIDDIGIEGVDLEPEIISTGLKDMILPLKSKEILDNIVVDNELLAKISEENNVVGLHAFYMPDTEGKEVYTRNFAPYVGIPEESATGSSNGALTYLLKREGILKGNELIAYQGELLKRPSEIICSIDEKSKVKVGGRARMALDGILSLS